MNSSPSLASPSAHPHYPARAPEQSVLSRPALQVENRASGKCLDVSGILACLQRLATSLAKQRLSAWSGIQAGGIFVTRAGSISVAQHWAHLALSLAVGGLCLSPLVANAAPAEGDFEETALYVSQVSTATEGDLAPGAQIVGEGQPLSVAEAVALAIRNSLDVEVERFAPLLARSRAEEAWGIYDPFLNADFGYSVRKSPNTFSLNDVSANRDRFKGGGVGVVQKIPLLGATIGIDYAASSTSTRSTLQSRDEQFDSSVAITATIPLARGLVWNQEWTNVKVSRSRYHASREDFRAEVMDTVVATVNAYWNLAASRDRVRVAQKSLDTARALLDQTKTQYEVGVVSRVEVVESEAGVADREFDVISRANGYRNAQDILINVTLGSQLSALTDLEFAPSDDPEAFSTQKIDVGRAVKEAFANRPELKSFANSIEQRELEVKFAKNQRLPQFDANVEFGYVGISGEPNVGLNPAFGTPPPSAPFDQSDNDFFTGRGSENVRVTGVFSIPFPNTVARKRVVQRQIELRRAQTRRTRLEQKIIVEVRAAARTLGASGQGIEAAERRRLAAEEQLRAERIRLEHGESTPFQVLERESDLVEAESQKIGALQTYHAAEVGLDRARGTILDVHRVQLESIEAREY